MRVELFIQEKMAEALARTEAFAYVASMALGGSKDSSGPPPKILDTVDAATDFARMLSG